MNRFLHKIAIVLLNAVVIGSLVGAGNATDSVDRAAPDPLNASYLIEGQPIALVDGHRESPAAPGSATTVRTAVWKQPAFGDLDGDGDEDAALLLTHDPGGSGTFYYVAAAVSVDGRYQGTHAVLLGDRIAPTGIEIRNDLIVVKYTDRRPEEPLSATPSVNRTKAVVLKNRRLLAATSPGDIEKVSQGWVTIGHEVRSFKPCDGENDLWLMGQSPALKAITAAYRQAVPDQKAYRPVFMVLAGKPVEPPGHGFAADFNGAFLATRLVRVTPGASCRNDPQDIDSQNGHMHKITFDISTLDKDGLYGSTGGKRALSYAFCIPDTAENRAEVAQIDPTITFSASPGRIGCITQEILCIGSTHQRGFADVLHQLAMQPYVKRINECFFE